MMDTSKEFIAAYPANAPLELAQDDTVGELCDMAVRAGHTFTLLADGSHTIEPKAEFLPPTPRPTRPVQKTKTKTIIKTVTEYVPRRLSSDKRQRSLRYRIGGYALTAWSGGWLTAGVHELTQQAYASNYILGGLCLAEAAIGGFLAYGCDQASTELLSGNE